MSDGPVVVLTAFNLEYEAVRQRLADHRTRLHQRGTRFEECRTPRTGSRVVLGMTGKGNHPAAVIAERAIQHFSPKAVFFVGVAGALWDTTALGDVVVATHVYAYHGSTSEDAGTKARPRVWEAAHGITQLAAHLSRTGGWADAPPQGARSPRVHFGAIAAGEVVQNSRLSHEARWIREHYNDALAIEMEAAGVAQAGHLNGSPVAIVRGISDRADGTKGSDSDGTWQPRAAANAAAFAVRLAEEMTEEQEKAVMRKRRDAGTGTTVNNFASGQVGIQAANVTGSTVVLLNSAPAMSTPKLADELSSFSLRLRGAHAAGDLDTGTYEAAKAELEAATEALGTGAPEREPGFVLALKRLHGLVSDVTDLATRVVALIAAAKGLS
ncbi:MULTISPECIES: 5'-methylthioadenosine/S-adenosylhomocysteine nucleosidase [Actinosynnema]|uniref:5'-methylthioadenosine/S-adenosylhomocysteine nucleosidase family protein n=1 Tax=Actinosynnema TaxID=40566 RepID=UPI0020A307A7|nr:5'-methylthioadenosine/S-adenosylhomocysteine nucleosidase [Actinosynnema pretiosum]MCP2097258.1 Nucleoside phosphorylase [Actinosynnema pretiosum]